MISREAAKRASRLHTIVIPATRLAGLTVVSALMPLQNALILGNPRWAAVGAFVLVASLYCLGSWLLLKAFFVRCRRIPLADLFLVADIFLLLFAVDLTGGPKSWLFLLLAGRCIDQLAGGFRRTVWFNHLLVGSYALYLLFFAARHGEILWTLCAAKLSLLYAFNWYCSLAARTVDSLRARARRAELAKRNGAEITATIAHSIRTSTEGITVLTERLARASPDARVQYYVRGLGEFSQEILQNVHSVDPGASEPSPAAVQEESFSPRALIEEVTSLMRPLAELKGLDFRVEIGIHVPLSMRGDAAKIRQVLLSLTHNAIRFTEVGFVELGCSRLWPGHVAFQIQDSGPGIPAHVRKHLSAGFKRADGTVWHRYRGAQLGLSISKRLVELMGGRLVFHSQPRQGTTVLMAVPVGGKTSFFATRQSSFAAGRECPTRISV